MKFRKKPVVIEAVRWTGSNVDEICGFILAKASVRRQGNDLIKGVEGEFYPCKPDIFAKTYSPEVGLVFNQD